MTKDHLKVVIGLCAFVIGGIMTQQKAVEAVDTLDDFVHRHASKAKQKAVEKEQQLHAEASRRS